MKTALKIDPPSWLEDKRTQKLIEAIGGKITPVHSMFVGGCVRNTVLKESVQDLDIATILTPEEVIKRLQANNIKSIPTGLSHGTVTAILDGKIFEITTLRHDKKTDGRHAEVSFTDDWGEDAKRRDFTINSLLMDSLGNIYDPTGLGMKDIQARRIVFVGDPDKRVQEDYLRILRFFRFYAQYGQGKIDSQGLTACKKFSDQIQTLSRERITAEFFKILETDKAPDVIQLMKDHHILTDLIDKNYKMERLEDLIAAQVAYKMFHPVSRLFVVAGYKARIYEDYLRFSHAQQNFLVKLEMVSQSNFFKDNKNIKKAIYHHGRDLIVQGYLLTMSKGDVQDQKSTMDILLNWEPPECPITGATLLAEGYKTGPELGQELARRQEEWIERNFSLL